MWEQNRPAGAKRRRGRPEQFTPQQVIDALLMERGHVTGAARRLGCSRKTIHNYITRHAVIADMLEDYHGVRLDRYELALERKAQKGSVKAGVALLGTYGRGRGWGQPLAPVSKPPVPIVEAEDSDDKYRRVLELLPDPDRSLRVLAEYLSALDQVEREMAEERAARLH